MSSLIEKLQASSTIAETNTLGKSILFAKSFVAPTGVPMFNVALSGSLDGGVTPGITQFAGPSKHFKTLFGMICVKAYMDKFKDAMVLFYDAEFGAGWQYFDNLGIPRNRVLHTPITNIEELKHDLVTQLKNITRGDHVIIFVDSVGNMASKKELDDAEEGKSVTDMTRAKALKSLFRMVTPLVNLKDLPMIVINHTYKTLEMFSKDVVGGGTGSYYSSQQVFIIGRQQEKVDKDVVGYNFIINVDKSRFVQEKSKIPISVTFEKGVSTWSGLLETALEGGFVQKPKNATYTRLNMPETFKEAETDSKKFWSPVLLDEGFQTWIQKQYKLANNQLLSTELTDEDVAEEYETVKKPAAAKDPEMMYGHDVEKAVDAISDGFKEETKRSARAARRAMKEASTKGKGKKESRRRA